MKAVEERESQEVAKVFSAMIVGTGEAIAELMERFPRITSFVLGSLFTLLIGAAALNVRNAQG